MIRENLIRKRLESGEPTVATRIWNTNPFITETIGNSGNFDYIEFAAEYAPFTQVDLENICRAAELYNMGTLIKVDFQNRGYVAQKAMAAGFQAIMFTDHETPEQVRESIRLTTPATPDCKGMYGYPMRRFIGGQSHVSPMTHARRVKQVVRCFMIEKVSAMEHIEEICAIPGVDMVQFGSGDWGMNQGFDRTDRPEECKAAEREMISCALRHGVRPRCEIATPEAAEYYKKLGVKDFCLNDEMAALRRFWFQDGETLRRLVKG